MEARRSAPGPQRVGGRARAALLVEPGREDALVAAIRQAVEMPEKERATLGQEARRLVLDSFTWDRNVAAVLDRLRAGADAPRESSGRSVRERT